MRRAAFVAVVAIGWLVLLLWAAGVDWRSPVVAESTRVFPGSRFRAVLGHATVREQRLHVDAADADHAGLQTTQLPMMEAERFPLLRYRFHDFPRTLELSLVFRTAEQPDDVRTISLPWPGGGTESVDLSRVEEWRGTIMELGFAQFATGQVVPASRGFAPFVLERAELWTPSWRGHLAALATDWFGAWPWSQRSVHALGREGDVPRAHSIVLFSALAIALAVGASALLLRLRGRRLLGVLAGCGILAWLALDLRWQHGLVHRLQGTQALYGGLDWPGREALVADEELREAALRVKALLRDEPAGRRILVAGTWGYANLRMLWHLQPLDVGTFWLAVAYELPLPEGTLLVFLTDAWRNQPAVQRLLEGAERVFPDGAVLADGFEADDLAVFRVRHAH